MARRRRRQKVPNQKGLCGSACWDLIGKSMVKFAVDMEKNCPKEPEKLCDLEEEKRKHAEEKNEPQTCMFDMCTMSMGPLGTLSDVCKAGNITGALGPGSMYKMSLCVLNSFTMICDSVCHATCQSDNAAERTLFCANKTAEEEEEPVECSDDQQSASEMEDMFNLMCAKNEEGKYCQAMGGEWEKKGAFKGDPTEVFPDPCAIDCNSPTGQALKDMGCCWGSFINAAENNPAIMQMDELNTVKAATFKCAGMEGMRICNGGVMLPTEVLTGKKGVSTCPTTTLDFRRLKATVAKDLKVPSTQISLVACTSGGSTGCEGGSRRLASTTATLNYAVKVTGSDKQGLETKKASVSSSIAAELAKAPVPTSKPTSKPTSEPTSKPTSKTTSKPTSKPIAPVASVSASMFTRGAFMNLLLGMSVMASCMH